MIVLKHNFVLLNYIKQKPNTVNSRYSGHLWDIVLCPEYRESIIPGVIFGQTSIHGDLNFVRISECP